MAGWGVKELGLNIKSVIFAFIWGAFCLWIFKTQPAPAFFCCAIILAGIALVSASSKSLSTFLVCVVFFVGFSFAGALTEAAFWLFAAWFSISNFLISALLRPKIG